MEKYKDAFKRNLEFCLDIGGDSIRVDTAVGAWPAGDRGAIWRRYVSAWRDCSDLAAKSGVDLYWEFEPGFIINKPSDVARLTDDVGKPNFKLMFDTCHAQMSGVEAARQDAPPEKLQSVVEFIDRMGKRIGTVHLIDSDNTLHHDETSTHAPFGEGVLDFDAIIEELKAQGYTGPVVDDRPVLLADSLGHRGKLASLRRQSAEAASAPLSAAGIGGEDEHKVGRKT